MTVNQTEREEEVLTIFRQFLNAPHLGPEQNFFEAGGTSLLASRVVVRLRTSGVLDVPSSAIFAAPTARSLSMFVSSAADSSDANGPESQSSPSSAAQRGARQRAAFTRLRRASSSVEDSR